MPSAAVLLSLFVSKCKAGEQEAHAKLSGLIRDVL